METPPYSEQQTKGIEFQEKLLWNQKKIGIYLYL